MRLLWYSLLLLVLLYFVQYGEGQSTDRGLKKRQRGIARRQERRRIRIQNRRRERIAQRRKNRQEQRRERRKAQT